MYQVLIPQDITQAGKDYLQQNGCEVIVLQDSSVETICREVTDCDAILARTASYPRKVFEAGRKLKVIARYGVGVDNFDIDAAAEHGVWVVNTPHANANSVAEHTVALLLACASNIVKQDRRTREVDWDSRNQTQSREVQGKTLGIVGCGHIGQMVAVKASQGLGMRVVGCDAYLDSFPDGIFRLNTVQEVFSTADYISLHIPATEETKELVNREMLGLMKPTAVLINCARGGIVDEKVLYEALRNRRILAAGIDVFEQEPPDKSNPLFQLDNVIVSPHNAALTVESMDQMGLDAARGIIEVLTGKEPTWPVNRPIIRK